MTDESSCIILYKWATALGVHQRTVEAWMLERRSGGSVTQWGHFDVMIWIHLSSLQEVPLQISTKLFCVIIFILWWNISYPDGSGRLTDSLSMRMIIICCCGLRSHFNTVVCWDNGTALHNTYGRFWTDVLFTTTYSIVFPLKSVIRLYMRSV